MGCTNCSNALSYNSTVAVDISSDQQDIIYSSNIQIEPIPPSYKNSQESLAVYLNPKETEHKKDWATNDFLSSYHNKSMLSSSRSIVELFPARAMLKEINFARTNPLEYIKKIEKFRSQILIENNTPYLFIPCTTHKIRMNQGFTAIDHCITYLKKWSHSEIKLAPLIMKDELKIPFPIMTPHICVEKEYIRNVWMFKAQELENKIPLIDFHYDLCINNFEISTWMQIIDDTNCNYQRRRNIFNRTAKYIGITEGVLNKQMCCYYLMFAEEKKC